VCLRESVASGLRRMPPRRVKRTATEGVARDVEPGLSPLHKRRGFGTPTNRVGNESDSVQRP